MGFLSPPARPSRNEVADEELLLETAVRHCCRPGHAGVGVSQAQAVQAALPAGERRGRRAARALFVHRLRRLPRSAARRARPDRRTAARARRRRPSRNCCDALRDALAHSAATEPANSRCAVARRAGRRRGLRPGATFRAVAGACASRRADAAGSLPRAAIAARVRSPDARRRAAARGQRKRAHIAAQAGRTGAAWRDSSERQAHPLLAGCRQPEPRTSSFTAFIARRNTSRRATFTSSCCRCASPASASWSRSRPIARCDC